MPHMTFPPAPTVVCGIDGTDQARCAARVAGGLARALGARLVLAHVIAATGVVVPTAGPVGAPVGPPAGGPPGDAEDTEARAHALLGEVAAAAGAEDAERVVLPFGDPVRRLGALAEGEGALLLVTGTRDEGALRDALTGSVSGRLAADAPCPVLVVGPGAGGGTDDAAHWRGRRVVCGFDGSENALRGAEVAAGLAAALGGPLSLVQVVDGAGEAAPLAPPDHAELHRAAAAGLPGRPAGGSPLELDVRREVRHGDPAEQLERVAAVASAPLIVVGTRGRPPWRAAVLGSVSRQIVERARRPVLLVPPGVAAAQAA